MGNGANHGGHSMLGSKDLHSLSQGSTCSSLWPQNLSGGNPRSHGPQPAADPPACTPRSIYSALADLWLRGTWWAPTQSKLELNWALLIHENNFSSSSEHPNHISILFCLAASFLLFLLHCFMDTHKSNCELTSAPSAHRASSSTSL